MTNQSTNSVCYSKVYNSSPIYLLFS